MTMNEYELERPLKALANRRRLGILKYLKRNREAPVGEIAGAIRLSMKSTSRHLGVLSAADIVVRDQRSTQIFYSIAPRLKPMVSALLRIL